jgi:acetyltransferase-like isoleucine patch superfamily enzyme
MRSLYQRWATQVRAAWLRLSGVEVAPPLYILHDTTIRLVRSRSNAGRVTIGPRAMISSGVVIESWGGHVDLGANVFLGPYAVIYGHGGVTVGDNSLIAMHAVIVSSNHALPPLDRPIQFEPDVLRPTRIGRDVWIGAHATILGGVTIGDGCVVGAGAVVSRDLPPGSIAVGVPARVVGSRPPGAAPVSP